MLRPDPRPLPPDPRSLEAQLDFFQKLGYSTAQVQALQQKYGADTDKVLGELVHIGAIREAERGPVTTMSVLVPRGNSQAVAPELLRGPADPQTTEELEDRDVLRAVVIDGSNVAMSHGNKEVFSCLGIQLAVNYFLERGHTEVTVFVPSWRKEQPRPDVPITDQQILRELEKKKILVFTPSRRVGGRRVVCNDDCFIVKHAFESDGVVVSNDLYRDLQGERPEWRRFIEERLLMFSFVNNKFMLPDDPLGRHGPTLENFLRRFPKTQKRQACPYGKKCTYGIKCRFHHPERPKPSSQAVADELRQNSTHPPGSQKQASNRDGSVSELSLRLVEDMAQKLTLGHNSVSIKKHEAQVKSAHHSGKKTQTKKDKPDLTPERSSLRETSLPPERSLLRKTGPLDRNSIRETCLPPEYVMLSETSPSQDHISIQGSSSPEQLDSGLGSLGSQLTEAVWSLSDQQYRSSSGSIQSQYRPLRSAPCSCCSPGPFQLPLMRSHDADFSGYDLFCSPSCYTYPLNRLTHSQPPDFQHRRFHPHKQPPHWSDPFPAGTPEAHSPLGEYCKPGPSRKEREVVRKKLLAILVHR